MISHPKYQWLIDKQNYKCAACDSSDTGIKGVWDLDHCHDTGLVRGFLCHSCNVQLSHSRPKWMGMGYMIRYVVSPTAVTDWDLYFTSPFFNLGLLVSDDKTREMAYSRLSSK